MINSTGHSGFPHTVLVGIEMGDQVLGDSCALVTEGVTTESALDSVVGEPEGENKGKANRKDGRDSVPSLFKVVDTIGVQRRFVGSARGRGHTDLVSL